MPEDLHLDTPLADAELAAVRTAATVALTAVDRLARMNKTPSKTEMKLLHQRTDLVAAMSPARVLRMLNEIERSRRG